MGAQFPVADVERLVVDQQPDQLPVGHIDDGLPRLRVPVAGLRVGQRALLEYAVEVGARQPVRFPLIEVRPPPDLPVGQREHRLGLSQHIEVEVGRP